MDDLWVELGTRAEILSSNLLEFLTKLRQRLFVASTTVWINDLRHRPIKCPVANQTSQYSDVPVYHSRTENCGAYPKRPITSQQIVVAIWRKILRGLCRKVE